MEKINAVVTNKYTAPRQHIELERNSPPGLKEIPRPGLGSFRAIKRRRGRMAHGINSLEKDPRHFSVEVWTRFENKSNFGTLHPRSDETTMPITGSTLCEFRKKPIIARHCALHEDFPIFANCGMCGIVPN